MVSPRGSVERVRSVDLLRLPVDGRDELLLVHGCWRPRAPAPSPGRRARLGHGRQRSVGCVPAHPRWQSRAAVPGGLLLHGLRGGDTFAGCGGLTLGLLGQLHRVAQGLSAPPPARPPPPRRRGAEPRPSARWRRPPSLARLPGRTRHAHATSATRSRTSFSARSTRSSASAWARVTHLLDHRVGLLLRLGHALLDLLGGVGLHRSNVGPALLLELLGVVGQLLRDRGRLERLVLRRASPARRRHEPASGGSRRRCRRAGRRRGPPPWPIATCRRALSATSSTPLADPARPNSQPTLVGMSLSPVAALLEQPVARSLLRHRGPLSARRGGLATL